MLAGFFAFGEVRGSALTSGIVGGIYDGIFSHSKRDTVMLLSDTAIRNAKPTAKPYKLTDGDGMYLLVNQVGRYFRFDYRHDGKRISP